jgi:dienelactone hydrolase
MDLANFIEHLALDQYGDGKQVAAIGTSLGAAILWYVFLLLLTDPKESANLTLQHQELRRAVHYEDLLTHDLCRPSTTTRLSLGLGTRVRQSRHE